MTEEQSAAARMKKTSVLANLPALLGSIHGGSCNPAEAPETGISSDRVRKISEVPDFVSGRF